MILRSKKVVDTRKIFNQLTETGLAKKQAEAFLYLYHNKYLNTLTWYKKLIESGFTEPQAEILTAMGFKYHCNIEQDYNEFMNEHCPNKKGTNND
jgi:hypothetical protein